MIIRKTLILLFFLFTTSQCGYTPIYSDLGNNINLKIISSEGDQTLNNRINLLLKKYDDSDVSNNQKFIIEFSTSYKKSEISKNTAGSATNYSLTAIADFKITYNGQSKEINIQEKFIMKKIEDIFERNNYEKKIKHNFATNISQKLISQLVTIK
tara:strand:+ start:498 stop:962 length:465 start_codon:yes stop_codon:yes gene_type:complete